MDVTSRFTTVKPTIVIFQVYRKRISHDSLDVTNTVEVTQEDQDKFSDFMSWVSNYNEYIINAYAEKASPHNGEDDAAITDGMIDIELEEEVA